jgi:DNA-directed RNA polymerase subunit RPC12/RpoP
MDILKSTWTKPEKEPNEVRLHYINPYVCSICGNNEYPNRQQINYAHFTEEYLVCPSCGHRAFLCKTVLTTNDGTIKVNVNQEPVRY